MPVPFPLVTTFKIAETYKKLQWTNSAHIAYAWHALLLWHTYLHRKIDVIGERSEQDTLSRSSMENAIRIYV